MGLETIIGGVIAAIVACIAAFAAGSFKARTKANADNTARNATEAAKLDIESNRQATEAQLKAAKNAQEIADDVYILPDDGAASELRRNYSRD